jgi:uncharacterized lipoprotein YddW (UPF0748 family)
VRPACDAIYPSKLEPWSYYLTGQMGQSPEPFYDPLEFAITEAHKRGLELHAWFNPYRAELFAHKYPVSKNHISRTHPEMVLKYGNFLWLDPGLKEVQDYSLRVVMDVVKRYDIDGVHFDDYFYPYREKDAQSNDIHFPDDTSWRRYRAKGKLDREDWRRENVNQFVERVYNSIKAAKPWVKFGISPFGIWQPGYPQQIKGFNSYEVLYCDSRKWLANGWLDYCAPQLYWAIDAKDQSFPVLLKWWLENNPKHRNIWPGLDSERVGGKWQPEEILNQVKLTRELSGNAPGEIHWSIKALSGQRSALGQDLASGLYGQSALMPPSPWLGQRAPTKPSLSVENGGKVKWATSPMAQEMSLWVLQTKDSTGWHTRILPRDAREETLAGSPDVIALTAIDRYNVASQAAALQKGVPEGNNQPRRPAKK